jgi:hypothetical protein
MTALNIVILAAPRTVLVNVFIPDNGGAETNLMGRYSSFLGFVISQSASLSSVSPAEVWAGSDAFLLLVNGTGFSGDSVVRWNGTNQPTTLVNATQLAAVISPALAAFPGTASITVANTVAGDSVAGELTLVVAPPPPGGELRLSVQYAVVWPDLLLQGVNFETADDLAGPWTAQNVTPGNYGSKKVVLIETDGARKVFRLRKP